MKTGKRKIFGTTERPRLSVYVSSKHIHAQIIDDEQAVTRAAASTLEKGRKKDEKSMSNIKGAKIVGEKLGKAAVAKGVKKVVFDRGEKRYHGKVKALAEAARAAGLEF